VPPLKKKILLRPTEYPPVWFFCGGGNPTPCFSFKEGPAERKYFPLKKKESSRIFPPGGFYRKYLGAAPDISWRPPIFGPPSKGKFSSKEFVFCVQKPPFSKGALFPHSVVCLREKPENGVSFVLGKEIFLGSKFGYPILKLVPGAPPIFPGYPHLFPEPWGPPLVWNFNFRWFRKFQKTLYPSVDSSPLDLGPVEIPGKKDGIGLPTGNFFFPKGLNLNFGGR